MFNNRKQNEEMSLQILQSILETNNPISVLEDTVDFLYSKNKKKLAEFFENAKEDIELNAKSVLDAFYENNLITERTYKDLKSINELSNLDYKKVEELIKQREEESKYSGKIMGIILRLIGMAVFTLLVALPSLLQTKKLTLPALKGDMLEGLYRLIILKPLIGIPLITIIIIGIIYSIVMLLKVKIIKNSDTLYRFVNYVGFFREAKIPYSVILSKYVESFPKDIKALPLQEILEMIEYERAKDAFLPLINKLNITEAVVAKEKIGSENADLEAWKFLKRRINDLLELKYATIEKFVNGLYYLILVIVILFAFYPLGLAIMSVLNKF